MARTYYQLLPYVFKRFSLLKAFRTGIPTLRYVALERPLRPSDASTPLGEGKPALCTMNILPPMATVWYHLTRKALGDRVDIVIFDCSGHLKAKEFMPARVLPFLNPYAATKCNTFLYRLARHRKRRDCVTGFSGMSAAVMLLWYFRTKEQILEYLLQKCCKRYERLARNYALGYYRHREKSAVGSLYEPI